MCVCVYHILHTHTHTHIHTHTHTHRHRHRHRQTHTTIFFWGKIWAGCAPAKIEGGHLKALDLERRPPFVCAHTLRPTQVHQTDTGTHTETALVLRCATLYTSLYHRHTQTQADSLSLSPTRNLSTEKRFSCKGRRTRSFL